ncbi:MAG: ABC transporter substrate-binding protein [Candidatus Dormibacteria bacterium]
MPATRRTALATLVALVWAAPACGLPVQGTSGPLELRLGYQPNLTHAPALVGISRGFFARDLGPGVRLVPAAFASGSPEVEALFAGSLDAAFLGPGPALNAFVKSKGQAIRVVAGAASGGASLVVRAGITSAADLRGQTLASPQLGQTQDVALRTWLTRNGLHPQLASGGDVTIAPQDNAQTLATFESGAIAGAWVPEPWATRLLVEGGGHVLVDERDLWPGGDFATTVLAVSPAFMTAHPGAVRGLVQGDLDALDHLNANPGPAREETGADLAAATGHTLAADELARAWTRLRFTPDPLTASFSVDESHAELLGLQRHSDLAGLFDLAMLNDLLRARGRPAVGSG